MKQIPEGMWDEELPLLMLAYQSSVQESTRFTPYRLMCGREVQLPIEQMFGGAPCPGETHCEYVTHLQKQLEGAYRGFRTTYIKHCNTRSSAMTIRLVVGDTK